MRIPRFTWLLLPLLLVGVYFVQQKPHSTRAQASVTGNIPVIGGATASSQTAFSGLWRVDGNFESMIHIKNSLVVAPVEVTPVLYMADGTEYDVGPVTIPTTGTTVVSVNQALAQAPPPIREHLSSYGSAALRWRGIRTSVGGEMVMLDAPRSLMFTASFMRMPRGINDAQQTLEGLWWRHDPGVGGFVTFANHTSKTLAVTFQVIGSQGTTLPPESLSLAAHSTRMLDLDRLTQGLPGLENQAGGIRVQWRGGAVDIAATGGLENAKEGFSSNMQFWAHNLKGAPAPSALATVGMMTGEPDAAMGYPPDTRFTPYAVLRNSTPRPLAVKLVLQKTPGTWSFSLPLRLLKPLETIRVDIRKALVDANRADRGASLNLVVSYTGRQGELVVDAGSVDQTGNYTMSVLAQPLEETLSQGSPFWTVADGFDTMYILWNWTDQPEDVLVTFYASDGSGHFKLPVHLEAQGSAIIDMAKVIAAGQPDVEGNVFPAHVRGGSAVFSSPRGVTSPMSLAVTGVHFNPQLGVTGGCCIDCQGYDGLYITLSLAGNNPISSFGVEVGHSIQLYATAYYSDGTPHDFTGSSTWSSQYTNVTTVAAGLVTAVAAGSSTISASRSLTAQGVRALGCGTCPGSQTMTGQATAYVYTPIQHNYPSNPIPQAPCRISQFFDHISTHTGKKHKAEDVIWDDGNGNGKLPPYGTPVKAMEAGVAHPVVGTFGPASPPWPNCGTSNANYIKIKSDSDGYYTVYIHVNPSGIISDNQHVNAGDQIGVTDNSGCQSNPHLHVQREDGSGVRLNFTLPCANPLPKNNFWDGLADDDDPDSL